MKNALIRFREYLWILVPVIALIAVSIGFDRTNPMPVSADDLADVNTLIDDFQSAYSNEQTEALRQLFFAEAVVAYDYDSGESQRVHTLSDWIEGTQDNVFQMNTSISDTLSNREIQVFRNIAYVVCDYTYIDDDEIGRGVDIFTCMKMRGTWRILSLQFTGDEEAK
jgi:hypothetical protein